MKSTRIEEAFVPGSRVTINKHYAEEHYFHWSKGLPENWIVENRPDDVKKEFPNSIRVLDPRQLDFGASKDNFNQSMQSMYVHVSFLKAYKS